MPETDEEVLGLLRQLSPLAREEVVSEIRAKLDPDGIIVSLDTNTVVRRGLTVRLTPTQAVMLWKLTEARPGVLQLDDLVAALYGRVPARRGSKQTIRVLMSALRDRVGPLGADIENLFGRGYRLVLRGE